MLVIGSAVVQASTLGFSIGSTLANSTSLIGFGVMEATDDGGGTFTVTGMDFAALPGSSYSGASAILTPGSYNGNDNLVFIPGTPAQVDNSGLAFSIGGTNFLLTRIFNTFYLLGQDGTSSGFAAFSATEIPEPATTGLCGFALVGAAFGGYRLRRRKAAAK
jgi:hypothetical protein